MLHNQCHRHVERSDSETEHTCRGVLRTQHMAETGMGFLSGIIQFSPELVALPTCYKNSLRIYCSMMIQFLATSRNSVKLFIHVAK
jgi:hypothetical protein